MTVPGPSREPNQRPHFHRFMTKVSSNVSLFGKKLSNSNQFQIYTQEVLARNTYLSETGPVCGACYSP